jgi:hypothetical protein
MGWSLLAQKLLASFNNHEEACNMLCGKAGFEPRTLGTKAERYESMTTALHARWSLLAHFSFEMGWTLLAHFSFEMGWTLLAHFSFEMGWTLLAHFSWVTAANFS